MENIINEFRVQNGAGNIVTVDRLVCDYCEQHSMAMARYGYLYHAEPHLLNDWHEAVGMATFHGDYWQSVRMIIFDALGRSDFHKRVLLNNNTLAFGAFIAHYKMFLTIRGR